MDEEWKTNCRGIRRRPRPLRAQKARLLSRLPTTPALPLTLLDSRTPLRNEAHRDQAGVESSCSGMHFCTLPQPAFPSRQISQTISTQLSQFKLHKFLHSMHNAASETRLSSTSRKPILHSKKGVL